MNETELPKSVKEALEPKQILKETLTVKDLINLKNEEIHIKHPYISCTLKIRKQFFIDKVFNQPVAFYGEHFIISDTLDRVYPNHKVLLNELDMFSYVSDLLQCNKKSTFTYSRTLTEQKLKLGSVIQLASGEKGVVVLPNEEGEFFAKNIKYVPLKKNGELSKLKSRYVYASDKYEVIADELC